MSGLSRPLAVTLVSAGTLTFEILLVRLFAIEQFYHFAYMAIGVAMLGFGASGTFLALSRRTEPAVRERGFAWSAALAACALVAVPAAVDAITLDPTQIAWERGQWARLAVVYLLLALPFGLGALAILLALTLDAAQPGRIYGASFVGAGVGAVLALAVLWVLPPAGAPAVAALLAALGAVCAAVTLPSRGVLPAVAAIAAGVVAGAATLRPLWSLDITPYKPLPQTEAYPDAQRVAERTSPVGWMVAVRAPAFRYAPGLSLAYRGVFPRQTGLFVDGQIAGALSEWGAAPGAARLLEWLPTAAPFAAGPRERVLVLGAGGGTDVWTALVHGAQAVVAVELHPHVVALSRQAEPDLTERNRAAVEWVVGDARHYVAAADRRFDLISLGPAGGFGTVAAGVHALNEDFLHTVEAYTQYLGRLRAGGVLAITRWLSVPPRESVRLILALAEALRRHAPGRVPHGFIVLRSWGTVTVLAKPDGFTAAEVGAVAEWAAQRRFDLDWYPGITQAETRFNLMAEPTLYRAATAAAQGRDAARRFAATYPFEVVPARDARPYPHHYLHLAAVRQMLARGAGDWLPFAEWGYLALLATLVQSVVVAAALMLLPTALRTPGLLRRPPLVLAGYFTAIGLGYLAAEIAAIQQLSLLLGHPVYAVAAVLATLLVCSGAGSIWSDRAAPSHGRAIATALGAVLVLYAAVLLPLVHVLQSAPLIPRAAVAVLLIAPPAFLMGVPFPVGLRALARGEPPRVAWAWATNGFASVVAAPLSALIAIEAGSRALFLAAAAAYGAAALVFGRPRATNPSRG